MSRHAGKIVVVLHAVDTHFKLPISARYGLISRSSTHLGGWLVPWSLRPEYEQQLRGTLSRKRKSEGERKGKEGKGKEKKKDGSCISLKYTFI